MEAGQLTGVAPRSPWRATKDWMSDNPALVALGVLVVISVALIARHGLRGATPVSWPASISAILSRAAGCKRRR